MIAVLKKLYQFAGDEQKNINKSIFWGFFYAVFHMFQIAAIYFVVLALTGGDRTYHAAWTALLLLVFSIAGRALINRFTQLQQTHAGYFMVANKRIAIGDKLKRIPMGYFNARSLGEITGISTTVLDVVESNGPVVLVNILPLYFSSACSDSTGASVFLPLQAQHSTCSSLPPWRKNPPGLRPAARNPRHSL